MITKVVVIIYITTILGYNLDTDFPIIYSHGQILNNNESSPIFEDAYFGYSVLLYHEWIKNRSWLIVGAPRGNYTRRSLGEGFSYPNETGVVYRCIIGKTCREIRPDVMKNQEVHIRQLGMRGLIKKQQGWFGSAMSISKVDGLLTMCAPRTTLRIYNPFDNMHMETMQGVCYYTFAGQPTREFYLLDEAISLYDFSTSFWYNPLHGFSVHERSIKSKYRHYYDTLPELHEVHRIIGEPQHELYGMVNTLFWYATSGESFRFTVDLPMSDELSHFGYSVTSGCFFKENEILYASGAPGWQYVGQVGILDPASNSSVIEKLYGSDIGEYFGASLASGDLNNDALDDLVIGAPYWGNDNGKVYVFFGSSKGQFEKTLHLQGTAEQGYFGYAIACGDIDADGFGDIIVSAPWEDQGVIYVYNGGDLLNKSNTEASQRISVSGLPGFNNPFKIERFGFSISEPIDIDQNGYLDVAVGAYKSGHAVILRAKPVVKTNIAIETFPSVLQRDAKEFLVKVCTRYDGYKVKSRPDFKITLFIDERLHRVKETRLEFRVINSTELCVNANVMVLEGVQDFIEPISIFAHHDILNGDAASIFCKTCPIERKNSKSKIAGVLLPYDIGCGEDKVCNAFIIANAEFQGVSDNDTWIIGSNDISLKVNLQNFGEPAYFTTLTFSLPEEIILRSILPSCQEDNSEKNLIVICNVENPIVKGVEKSINLDLDMRHLINGSSHGSTLSFLVAIETRSKNTGTVNVTKVLNLRSQVSLSLNGKATEECYYSSVLPKDTANISFQHTYQVYKLGPTPIESARLVVKVPTTMEHFESFVRVHKPRLYVSGELFDCSSEDTFLLEDLASEMREGLLSSEFDLSVLSEKFEHSKNHEISIRDDYASIVRGLYLSTRAQVMHAFYDTRRVLISKDSSTRIDTIYFNCSAPNVNCTTITCDLGALKTPRSVGKVLVNFFLNADLLKGSFANNRNILKFSTKAHVEIIKPEKRLPVNGTRVTVDVSTLFYNSPQLQQVQLWIILLSVTAGLLLLLLLVGFLRMAGFFQRSGQHELQTEEQAKDCAVQS